MSGTAEWSKMPPEEEPVVVEATDPVEQSTETAGGESAGNPAWEGLRSKLDPTTFKLIEPELRGWETSAQKRIEESNKQYGWAAELAKQGVTPEQVQASLNVAQRLEANPQEIYDALGNYLRENGTLPNEQQLAKQVEKDAEDSDEETEDPRFAQLAQQQEQIAQYLAMQQQQEQIAQASRELDAEIDSLKKTHKDFSEDDVQEVVKRAALTAQMTGNVPSLEDMATEYIGLRNRILTTPRAADSAPKLLPTGGGIAAAGGEQKTLGQLDKSETQNLVAQLLTKGAV